MRVHLVHFYSTPGGIEVLSSRLIQYSTDIDFRVFTIRPPVAGTADVYEGSGVTRSYGAKGNFKAWVRLLRYARQNRRDIFHLLNAGPYYLLAAKLAGADKIVYSIRGTRYWSGYLQGLVRKFIWVIALNRTTRLIANSDYSKQVFREKINSGTEIMVLYNPLSSLQFIPKPERTRSGIIKIIYVGRLARGKNLEGWIDLACTIHERMPDTMFEIYGSGPMEALLRQRISGWEADNYIALKGFRADIENVYREADLLLFLSECESFGNVVVESILCGTPVVAADIPSMREIFGDYPAFLISQSEDLGLQVCDKLLNYEALLFLAQEAAVNFRYRFSMHTHAESLKEIYNSLDEKFR